MLHSWSITYIRLRDEFVFLAVILVAHSRRVGGWVLDRTLSMSRKDNPWDNAACEPFMKTLKYEKVHRSEYRDLAEARASIHELQEKVYGQKRVQSALGYVPPAEFEANLAAQASMEAPAARPTLPPSTAGTRATAGWELRGTTRGRAWPWGGGRAAARSCLGLVLAACCTGR